MLKSPALWAVLGLLLGIALGGSYIWGLLVPASESSHAIHRNHQHDGAKNSDTCADKGGTPECPLFVQRIPSEAEKRKAAEDAEDEHEKARREWQLVIATWGIVFVTFCLAGGTVFLANYTFNLWEATQAIASDANKSARRLIDMERPYVTGGGDFENEWGKELFRLDVENHGKTAAFMTGYDLQFAKLADLRREHPKVRPVCKNKFRHIDGISPQGARKEIRTQRKKLCDDDVVFGAIYYRDIFNKPHHSRFILRIAPWRDIPGEGLTRLDVEGVSSEYWSWDIPENEQA